MATVIRKPEVGTDSYLLKNTSNERTVDYISGGAEEGLGSTTSADAADYAAPRVGNTLAVDNSKYAEVLNAERARTYEQKIKSLELEIEALRETDSQSVKTIRENAFNEGFELGLNSGKEHAQVKVRQIGELLENLESQVKELVAEQEDAMVEVVFAAVCKLIGKESSDRRVAIEMVRNAIRELRTLDKLAIRVSPDVYQTLEDHRKELFNSAVPEQFRILADEQVKLGGCILETDTGSLDNRLEVQLQILKETLLDVRNRAEH